MTYFAPAHFGLPSFFFDALGRLVTRGERRFAI